MRVDKLINRDPAMAALMGVIGVGNVNFGGEFGDDDLFGDDDDDLFGDDEFGDDEFGDDAEFGAIARPKVKTKMAARNLVKKFNISNMARRRAALMPNRGSSLKVERYTFSLSETITLGTAQAFTQLTSQPDVTIRPQRMMTNAPTPMFAFIQEIKMANVSISVGSGQEDAYNYNANAVGGSLDMPTLSPANRATVLGNYTGFTPPGFVPATLQTFNVAFKGPASLVAQ